MNTTPPVLGTASLLWQGHSHHQQADWKVYAVEPPLDGHDTVLVSATVVPFSGPETYIFPAGHRDNGWDIVDFGELTGSIRGVCNHEAALYEAGYVVTGAEQ